MTVVLKLGGSVVTEKSSPETVDEAALTAAADAVAAADLDRLVIVHGAGSFGHHHADRVGVTTASGTRDAAGVLDIHGSMKRLNARVVDALCDREVPVVPVHPLSFGARDSDGELTLPLDAVETQLDEGFVPVLHGDGVAHAGRGVTILSGDEVVARLGADLDADRIGMCSTVPGVFDADGDVIAEIRSFEAVADALGGSDATDVTGGMAGKVRTLLDLGAPAHVFGPEGLAAFLRGESPGTRILGDG
jgi:isopentenyl phosphate kinase